MWTFIIQLFIQRLNLNLLTFFLLLLINLIIRIGIFYINWTIIILLSLRVVTLFSFLIFLLSWLLLYNLRLFLYISAVRDWRNWRRLFNLSSWLRFVYWLPYFPWRLVLLILNTLPHSFYFLIYQFCIFVVLSSNCFLFSRL